jgi:branched-chain amino acid transport system ATP-binding protein
MKVLEVQDIHTYYGHSYVLQGVSLSVEEGQVAVVLGRNGVGKTTLIRSIHGFNPPRSGKIVILGQDTTHQPSYKIARLGVGLIPQGRRIFPSLSVEENLRITLRGEGKWTMDRVLSVFPRLRERLRNRGGNLSGGEQQMLASGRALLGNPHLLLMDEPTEGLAPLLIMELGRVIRELKEEGLSILLVEQNLPFALGLADHVYVMSKGTIVYESSPQELQHNAEVKAKYLGV